MAEIRVCYPGAFLLTFGQHRFEVYIDDTLVKASPGYLARLLAYPEAAGGRRGVDPDEEGLQVAT